MKLRNPEAHALLYRLAKNPGLSTLLTGLVAAWDLRDRAGKPRFDYGPNAYHLTNIGAAAADAGFNGTRFNGTNQYLSIAQAAAPLLFPASATHLTVAGTATFIANANTSFQYDVAGIWNGTTNNRGWAIARQSQTGGSRLQIDWSTNGTDTFSLLHDPVALNTPVHFVARYDGTNVKLYAGGTEVTAGHTTGINRPTAVNLEVGRFTATGGLVVYSNVRVDNLAIWSRALSDAERDEWYNAAAPKTFPFI